MHRLGLDRPTNGTETWNKHGHLTTLRWILHLAKRNRSHLLTKYCNSSHSAKFQSWKTNEGAGFSKWKRSSKFGGTKVLNQTMPTSFTTRVQSWATFSSRITRCKWGKGDVTWVKVVESPPTLPLPLKCAKPPSTSESEWIQHTRKKELNRPILEPQEDWLPRLILWSNNSFTRPPLIQSLSHGTLF